MTLAGLILALQSLLTRTIEPYHKKASHQDIFSSPMSELEDRDANASLHARPMQSDTKEDGRALDNKLERRTVNKLDLILIPAMRCVEASFGLLG